MARKILLADDSVTAQNMGRKILTDAGYEVITVNNGSAALKKIAEHKPDLIVLDVYMPGYSGLEVCQRIKEKAETARIPVLLTVGKLEPFKPEEARRARADAFVVKPFEASELLAALTKLEDKVIPQPEPYKQGRFAKAVASFERDTEPAKGEDDSWKARLRIPTAPKPRDPVPDTDYSATQGKGFRDLVESANKKQPPAAANEAAIERPLPAGIPHDITPDEIAAIAAAAAQLNGASATAPSSVPEIAPEGKFSEEKIHQATEADSGLPSVPAEEAAPMTFASAPEVAASEQASPSVVSEAESEPVTSAIANEAAVGPAEPVAETSSISATAGELSAETPAPSASVEPAIEDTPEAPKVEDPDSRSLESVASAPETEAVAPWPGGPSDVPTTATSEPIPVPPDEEVMAALQTLIPTTAAEPMNPLPTSEAVRNVIAEATVNADMPIAGAVSVGPRWIAEEVQMASDEMVISLQEEMDKAYAAVSAQAAPLAAVAVSAEEMAGPGTQSSETEMTPVQSVDQTMVYAMASAAGVGIGPVSNEGPSIQSAASEGDDTRAVSSAAPSIPSVEATEEGIASGGAESAADKSSSNESEIAGGMEGMAANWKNIRDSIAGAAAKPATEKEEFHEVEAAKAETEIAVAPASEKVNSASSVADPSAIASIVDSVLAELRPKIVEEIARKLADSKKD